MTKTPRVQVRKSPIDGLWRRWEYRAALSLGLITSAQIEALEAVDGPVAVCTGVFATRGAAFRP